MPPSDPTHGVVPAPRHGAGARTCPPSVVAISTIPNAVANTDFDRITEPPGRKFESKRRGATLYTESAERGHTFLDGGDLPLRFACDIMISEWEGREGDHGTIGGSQH